MTPKRNGWEWQLWINYGQGWEHEISEDTNREIRDRLREYRENCPQYPTKIKIARVPLTVLAILLSMACSTSPLAPAKPPAVQCCNGAHKCYMPDPGAACRAPYTPVNLGGN